MLELVVVVAVLAVLSAVALPSFTCFTKEAKATAAIAALKQIQNECHANTHLNREEKYTPSNLQGYQIQSDGSNGCYGNVSTGIVSAIPDDANLYPTFNLKYNTSGGELSYSFKSQTGTDFKECIGMICTNLIADGSTDVCSDPNQVISGDGKGGEWDHECHWSTAYSASGSGSVDAGSGKITLLSDGNIELKGSYLGEGSLNQVVKDAIAEGGFTKIFAGGYGGYAAQREDGSLIFMGYLANGEDMIKDDTDQMSYAEVQNALLSSSVDDVKFNYGAGGARLDNGQIVTWGHPGYRENIRRRLNGTQTLE